MTNFKSQILNTSSIPIILTKHQFKRGFTIVETLVAIAVLMIAIAGPLVIATKGLTSALYSKDQMIASFLARESMEVIRNKKVNNVLTLTDPTLWLGGIKETTDDNCSMDTDGNLLLCDASVFDATGIVNKECSTPLFPPIILGCRLYFDSSSGYNHDNSGVPTKFYRYYYVVPATQDDEMTVHVFVDWKEGTIPYQIHLTNQITNISR